jgi:hypothetical protein
MRYSFACLNEKMISAVGRYAKIMKTKWSCVIPAKKLGAMNIMIRPWERLVLIL